MTAVHRAHPAHHAVGDALVMQPAYSKQLVDRSDMELWGDGPYSAEMEPRAASFRNPGAADAYMQRYYGGDVLTAYSSFGYPRSQLVINDFNDAGYQRANSGATPAEEQALRSVRQRYAQSACNAQGDPSMSEIDFGDMMATQASQLGVGTNNARERRRQAAMYLNDTLDPSEMQAGEAYGQSNVAAAKSDGSSNSNETDFELIAAFTLGGIIIIIWYQIYSAF